MNSRTSRSLGTLLLLSITNMVGARAQQTPAPPAEFRISGSPIPTRVLVQSPAETNTELQVICLFESSPETAFHGSLVEMNEKLKGLLDGVRKPSLFRGALGETILLVPPAGALGAKKLLVVGLGDSGMFTPQRMELIGSLVFHEASRLGVAHPFFAPTVIDGGVSKFGSGDAAQYFFTGFLRAARTEIFLHDGGVSPPPAVRELTFLAGPAHAADTQHGLERALANP